MYILIVVGVTGAGETFRKWNVCAYNLMALADWHARHAKARADDIIKKYCYLQTGEFHTYDIPDGENEFDKLMTVVDGSIDYYVESCEFKE